VRTGRAFSAESRWTADVTDRRWLKIAVFAILGLALVAFRMLGVFMAVLWAVLAYVAWRRPRLGGWLLVLLSPPVFLLLGLASAYAEASLAEAILVLVVFAGIPFL
jgi:hypothetical protein